jgi:indolepyruvate ferredoxin oxidoreductase
LATRLAGDSMGTNLFMLGYTFQKGWLPLSERSLMRAIELNGVAVVANQKAFSWGRRAALDLSAVERIARPVQPVVMHRPETLSRLVERHVKALTAYQNAAYARDYSTLVEQVKQVESTLVSTERLTRAVAQSFFKLLTYKDEYEVARLYSDGEFMKKLRQQFDGELSVKFHLAPPLLAKKDATGHLKKREYSGWMLKAFGLLTKCKGLRGTRLDPFGWTEERRLERQLIVDYRHTVMSLLPQLNAQNLPQAVALASLAQNIKGFGHVKAAAVSRYRHDLNQALLSFTKLL